MPEFFPLGAKSCPMTGGTKCSTSIGVWGYECCGVLFTACCGSVTIAGWIVVGAIGLLIILVIIGIICRRR